MLSMPGLVTKWYRSDRDNITLENVGFIVLTTLVDPLEREMVDICMLSGLKSEHPGYHVSLDILSMQDRTSNNDSVYPLF